MCRLHVYSWWLLLSQLWHPWGQQPLPSSSDLPSIRRSHQPSRPLLPCCPLPPLAVSPPHPVFSMLKLLCRWLPCTQRPQEGAGSGGGRGQSHKHGLHGSQPHHASLSSAGTSGSHHLPFCLLRKRTHSPSSKDEQSIGLKDSLLAHSSDPVEMRRLNYQTPGKAAPSAGLPSPGLQAPGVSVEGPWPCAPFPFLCPSSCIIHLVEVTEEPLFPTAGQAPQGPGASQGKPRCLGFASSLV